MAQGALKACALGVVDGLREPYFLSSGLTWQEDQDANEAYDRGVNIGQALGLAWLRIVDAARVLRVGGRHEPANEP